MSASPTFLINPNFRLQSNYLSVSWCQIDRYTLELEAAFPAHGRTVFRRIKHCAVMAQKNELSLDFIYADVSDWNNKFLQKWLREIVKAYIFDRATLILPHKLHVLEQKHNLYARKVVVRKLRKNILGQCTHDKMIYLSPTILLLPEEYTDSVILHEMAHLKYFHHRKSFWNYLTTLLGEESRAQKVRMDALMGKFYLYSEYLMK